MKKTLVDLFEGSVANYANNVFLKEKIGKTWTDTTYAQTRDVVYEIGAGFVKLGVAPKDNMSLLSEGRNMWIMTELAMFYAGAANVPLSIKLEESNDLMFRLLHGDGYFLLHLLQLLLQRLLRLRSSRWVRSRCLRQRSIRLRKRRSSRHIRT